MLYDTKNSPFLELQSPFTAWYVCNKAVLGHVANLNVHQACSGLQVDLFHGATVLWGDGFPHRKLVGVHHRNYATV